MTGTARRLAEAARLGFTHAVVPAGSVEPAQVPDGMRVAQAADLAEAVRLTRPDAVRGRGSRTDAGAAPDGEG